jgi:hypothetical protein
MAEESIASVEHARKIINSLQRRADKFYQEALVAKARIYDYLYRDMASPPETDLKARVIELETSLKKVSDDRDRLLNRVASNNAKRSVSEEQDIKL